jgi:thiamine kinase-like enzyme
MTESNEMIQGLTYEYCIELMPQWQGQELKIDLLTGGITNKLYRVRLSDGGDYVVRVYGQKTDLFIDRDVEAENIRRMASAGVTAKLVKYLPEKNVTIVEYIAGSAFKNADFLKVELLETLVRPIKLIHKAQTRLPKLFDPFEGVVQLYRVFRDVSPDYPEFDIRGTIDVLQRIWGMAEMRHSDYVPCHNDLLADNFIKAEDPERYPEQVYLIDWEYAGMGTAYYDISDMFQEILVPVEIEEKILRIYWEDSNMGEHIRKTDMLKPFPDIYWFLWSLIQLNISGIEFDYYNYGKVKYENAQMNIARLRLCYGLQI